MSDKKPIQTSDYYSKQMWRENYSDKVRKENFKQGLPVVYLNDKKQIVREWEDGKIEIIKDAIVNEDNSFQLPKHFNLTQKNDCNKVKYATEKDALFALQKIKKTSTRQIVPIRAYLCFCKGWHLTSREDVNDVKKQNEILRSKIAQLEQTINVLKQQIKDMQNEENKIDKLKIKADERVVLQSKEIVSMRALIKRLREDNSNLISRLHFTDNKK